MAIVANAENARPKKRWNEVVKDDLKKCGLDRGLAKDRERWRLKLWRKRPTCASTDKGRKARREREQKQFLQST